MGEPPWLTEFREWLDQVRPEGRTSVYISADPFDISLFEAGIV
jgi:hypothetical protein